MDRDETVVNSDDGPVRGRSRTHSFRNEEEERLQRGLAPEGLKSAEDGEDGSCSSRAALHQSGGTLDPRTVNIVTNLEEHVRQQAPVFNEQQVEEAELAELEEIQNSPKTVVNSGGERSNGKMNLVPLENTSTEHDHYVKVLLLGDSGVGKTSLMLRFAENQFHQSLMSTAGVDFKVRYLEKNNVRTKCQIWDTAGQERFHVITRTYYKGAHGIALVFDVTNESSFKQVDYWMDNIKKHASSDIFVVLLGNKVDLPERKIAYEQGKEVADKHGFQYYETSAKTGAKVVTAFSSLSEKITNRREMTPQKQEEAQQEKTSTLNLAKNTKRERKMPCQIL